MLEAIKRVNGYDRGAYTYYPVLIIGAGESGIAMGCRLKDKLGFDQFRIFDRHAGIGGTWWINRYPGVACDVPAVFYSFSFATNNKWTTFHPPGPEIVKYLQDVCAKYQIVDKIELNTDVEECRWLEGEEVWEVTLKHLIAGTGDLSAKERRQRIEEQGEKSVIASTEKVRAKIVISGAGGLVEPRGWPEHIPGRETFEGQVFHSARWDYTVDFKDKDVVVVGTGCSAAQFVPRLTKEPYSAKSVTQLMRTPPWVVPRVQPPGGEEWWKKNSAWVMSNIPGLARTLRTLIFLGAEFDFVKWFTDTKFADKERKKEEARLVRHMKRTVPEKYHEILTPDYAVACKRRIFDATWFPGLQDSKIDLDTRPLTSVQARSVTIGPGRTYPDPKKGDSRAPTDEKQLPADIIVLANGFDVTQWFHPIRVVGSEGKDLIETMEERGGPQMYLGTAMDGFPNFFVIFGPNTATGHSSVILAIENMVEHTLPFVKMILDGDAKTVEVKQEAEVNFTRDIQEALSKTVFMSGGCQSWYYRADGWNSTVYPYTQFDFGYRCLFPTWKDWNIEYTGKGLLKKRLRRTLGLAVLAAVLAGTYRFGARGFADAVGGYVRRVVKQASDRLQYGVLTSTTK